MIRFKVANVNQIKESTYRIDCWFISMSYSRLQTSEGTKELNNLRITLLYAFYLMIREELSRARVMYAVTTQISLEEHNRQFQWFDEKSYWIFASNQTRTWIHFVEYQRRYNIEQHRWFWCLNNSFIAWDTSSHQWDFTSSAAS